MSGNKILTLIKGRYSNTNLGNMKNNNWNLYLVNVKEYTKFCQVLYICSQDIKQKRNSDQSRAITLLQIFKKMMRNNPIQDLDNVKGIGLQRLSFNSEERG